MMTIEPKLSSDDFRFDVAGNLVINTEKVRQVINSKTLGVKREPLKGGVSPI